MADEDDFVSPRSHEDTTAAIRRYRQRKRKGGLCGYNGCNEKSATYLCPAHNLAQRNAAARYRESCRIG